MKNDISTTKDIAVEINKLHHLGLESLTKGLQLYWEAGELLLEAKKAVGHGKWLNWVEDNLDFGEREARRYIQLRTDYPNRTLMSDLNSLPKALGENTNKFKANCTGNNEWYTPAPYIESARETLGSIDLDPASNPTAQKTIMADTYYTKENNGLEKQWEGKVWCNPPYASGDITPFVEKFIAEVQEGIILTHNATDTKWFQSLANASACMCFTSGRIKFYNDDGVQSAMQGQVFSYIGTNKAKFIENFSQYGFIVEVING